MRAFYDTDDPPQQVRAQVRGGWALLASQVYGPDFGAALDLWPSDQRALCAEIDPELFFPERGGAGTTPIAKALCGRCPLKDYCLERALNDREIYGIWGGTSEAQRRHMRRDRREPDELLDVRPGTHRP
jgi:WhiB family redox-sensing transcriptional regulator